MSKRSDEIKKIFETIRKSINDLEMLMMEDVQRSEGAPVTLTVYGEGGASWIVTLDKWDLVASIKTGIANMGGDINYLTDDKGAEYYMYDTIERAGLKTGSYLCGYKIEK